MFFPFLFQGDLPPGSLLLAYSAGIAQAVVLDFGAGLVQALAVPGLMMAADQAFLVAH